MAASERRTREYFFAGLAFLALMLVTVAVVDGWILFSKPLWLDEYHTVLLATRESLPESIRSLARGSDYNPPLLHLVVRALGTVLGGVSEISLRAFMFVSVWASLLACYLMLRGSLHAIAAFAGSLVLWAHPLVLRSAFDGRFYAPWLLLTALFALAADRSHNSRQTILNRMALGLAAAALCTIHYFGIITWGLVVLAEVWRGRHELRSVLKRLLPALAGPLALLACLPIFLGQRSALTVATWVPPLGLSQLIAFIKSVFGWVALVVVAAAAVAFLLRWRRHHRGGLTSVERSFSLLATALLAVALVAISVVLQPSLVDRYATPAALSLVPIAAYAAARGGRVFAIGLAACLLLVSGRYLYYLQRSAEVFESTIRTDASFLLSSTPPRAPIVAVDRATLYPLQHYDSALARRLIYLDLDEADVRQHFPPASASSVSGDFLLVERDVARIHEELYSLPRMVDPSELRSDEFLVVGAGGDSFIRRFVPDVTLERLADRIWLASTATQNDLSPGSQSH